jgi:ketosteroid isomerase-like protein
MSATVDLVRSIYAAWERGDYFTSTDWADPEIEFVVMDGLNPGALRGAAALEANWREFQGAWEDYGMKTEAYRQLDDERILVMVRLSGRGKASGLEVAQTGTRAATIFHVRGGKVRKLVVYWDGDRALADLGLTPEEPHDPR